jgi:NAD(P)-dependent dehydrogenase (short-subunit alcohol dehydrogenase family)
VNLGSPNQAISRPSDLNGTGVTVNVLVFAGITNTPMVSESGFNRAKMIQPEVMAPPLLWLVSDAAGKVTGQRFLGVHWISYAKRLLTSP